MANINNDRPLSLAKVREILEYDPETGIFIWRTMQSPTAPAGAVAGVVRKGGYRIIAIDRVQYKASRLAWFYYFGTGPEKCIDHLNGNRSDDRLCNLREATVAENAANKVVRGAVGVKGVYLRSDGFYQAGLTRHGKFIYLGSFRTLDDAALARQRSALEIQGEFAYEARK